MMKQSWRFLPVVLALAALAFGCARTGKTLSVFIWSEYIDPDLVERFEQQAGVKVVIDTYENTETMMS
jgi:spermidine/putrescine transport system substrate-binding protein